MKTFTVIGYSVLNGVRKVRIANNAAERQIILERNGHREVHLHEVEKYWPGAIVTNKEEAAALLATSPLAETLGKVHKGDVWFDIYADLAKNYKRVETESQPTFEIKEAKKDLTFEEALAQVPMRDKGRFIKREVREQMARDLMAQ